MFKHSKKKWLTNAAKKGFIQFNLLGVSVYNACHLMCYIRQDALNGRLLLPVAVNVFSIEQISPLQQGHYSRRRVVTRHAM